MENPNGGNQGESYENNDNYGYNQDVLSFPPSDDKYAEFMKTEPPMFSSTTYPLEADDWIKTIEEKLNMVQCNDREKALYASGHLIGAASDGGILTSMDMSNLRVLCGRNSRTTLSYTIFL
jgi:hypothetical protein